MYVFFFVSVLFKQNELFYFFFFFCEIEKSS